MLEDDAVAPAASGLTGHGAPRAPQSQGGVKSLHDRVRVTSRPWATDAAKPAAASRARLAATRESLGGARRGVETNAARLARVVLGSLLSAVV